MVKFDNTYIPRIKALTSAICERAEFRVWALAAGVFCRGVAGESEFMSSIADLRNKDELDSSDPPPLRPVLSA